MGLAPVTAPQQGKPDVSFIQRWHQTFELLRALCKLDYSLSQFWMRYISILGSGGYIAFYFAEAQMGYQDWWPLRLICILAPLPLFFYPRTGRLKVHQIIYFEFVGWLVLPFAQIFCSCSISPILIGPHPF